MKDILILAVMIFLASCGNPHISSTRDGLETSNPPIVNSQEEGCSKKFAVNDYEFFFAPKDLKKCSEAQGEDFGTQPDGNETVIYGPGYEVSQRHERSRPGDKVVYLDDIFESTYLSIEVRDHTLLSSETNASYIWSFSSPVRYWETMIKKQNVKIRIFDCDGALVEEAYKAQTEIVGFLSPSRNICYVAISSGNVSEFTRN